MKTDSKMSALIVDLQTRVAGRLNGRVSQLQLLSRADGLIIMGRNATYYAKQLVQHAVMESSALPIVANEIEVG